MVAEDCEDAVFGDEPADEPPHQRQGRAVIGLTVNEIAGDEDQVWRVALHTFDDLVVTPSPSGAEVGVR